MRRVPFVSTVVMSGLLASCSTSPAAPSTPYVPPPPSVVVDDPGPVKIRREAFVLDGVVAPPNPTGNAATPSEQNRFRVVRYRVDADPPRPARAIVVMMPGFLGGAGSLDGVARAVVRRSTDSDALEAWAIDRRSNLLEDTHGLDVAEARKDVSFAQKYYLDGAPVEGKTFEGFLNGAQAPWASEWGLAVTVGDLRKAIELVPQADRAPRVVLLGHSLGGALAEEYAAWDFAGVAGTKELAGLVLVDAVTGGEGKPAPYDQPGYEDGGPASAGAFGPRPGVVKDIRAGNTFVALPFLGVKAYMVSEYVAMQARWAPDTVSVDDGRDTLLGILLGQTPMPKLTNRAAFGFAFDQKSCGLQIAAIACGEGQGGPITDYDSVFGGKLSHPSDPNATYTWVDFDKTNPPGNTSIDDAARAWYEGPQLNFAEWYFPQRLTVDAAEALSLDVADDDWRSKTYGLVAKHGKEIDVPVLAVGSVVAKAGAYESFRAFLPPVGAGRPSAGKDRSDPDAFSTMDAPSLTHIDWVVGRDAKGSALGSFYDALGAFLLKQTTPGGVVIPVRN